MNQSNPWLRYALDLGKNLSPAKQIEWAKFVETVDIPATAVPSDIAETIQRMRRKFETVTHPLAYYHKVFKSVKTDRARQEYPDDSLRHREAGDSLHLNITDKRPRKERRDQYSGETLPNDGTPYIEQVGNIWVRSNYGRKRRGPRLHPIADPTQREALKNLGYSNGALDDTWDVVRKPSLAEREQIRRAKAVLLGKT